MAIEVKHICDKCKCEIINQDKFCNPKGWNEITLNINGYIESSFILCKECQVKLGIIKDDKLTDYVHNESNEFEELLDKLSELVAERIN